MNTFREADKKSVIQVLICYILWGLLPIFWKLLSALDSFYILASRIVWSAVFCFIIIICCKNTGELKKILANRQQMKLLACSSVMIAINWGAYIYAINSGHILDASLAYYMNPLLSIGLGFVFFKEKLKKLQWLAIAIAATGIMITIITYGRIPYYALMIGGSFAVYSAIKKNVTCDGLTSTLMEALLLAPLAVLYIAMSEHGNSGAVGTLNGAQLFLLPAAGVVTSIPLLAFSSGITKVPMSLSGILMYVNPTLQLIIGVILYQEKFDLAKGIMFIFVWVALVLFLYSGKKEPAKNKLQSDKEYVCTEIIEKKY